MKTVKAESKPVTCTIIEVRQIHNALTRLDGGFNKVIVEGEVEKSISLLYTFDEKLNYTIGKNLAFCEAYLKAFDKTRNAIVRKHAKGADKVDKADKEATAECLRELNALQEKESDYEFWPIDFEKLMKKQGEEPIPPAVLAALMPLEIETPSNVTKIDPKAKRKAAEAEADEG